MSLCLSEHFDVVVLDGGNAALTAAITAGAPARRVVVLEAAPRFYRGGNTSHTRSLRCSHDGTAPTMTGPYEVTEFLDDLYRVTGGGRGMLNALYRKAEDLASSASTTLP